MGKLYNALQKKNNILYVIICYALLVGAGVRNPVSVFSSKAQLTNKEQSMKEVWMPVEGYEKLYEVSYYGAIRSLPRNGTVNCKRVLKQKKSKLGYKRVGLTKGNKQKFYSTHRLVAKAFVPNTDNKPKVNHIDGNKENNFYDNLEWATSLENNLHAIHNGLRGNPAFSDKINCEQCGTVVEYIKHKNQRKRRFCSLSCSTRWRNINNHHSRSKK